MENESNMIINKHTNSLKEIEDKTRYQATLEKNIDIMQSEFDQKSKMIEKEISSCLDLLRGYKGNWAPINIDGYGYYIDVIRD